MFLADIASQKVPHWNEKVRGENEALEFCRENKLYIVEDKKVKFGSELVGQYLIAMTAFKLQNPDKAADEKKS